MTRGPKNYRELRARSENHRCAWCDLGDEMVAEIERLEAENERTHALVRDVSATRDTAVNMKLERDAEIERLRDLLAYNGVNPDAVVESAKGAYRAYKILMEAPKLCP